LGYLGSAMQTKTDNELVIGYAEGGNEAAFAGKTGDRQKAPIKTGRE
jgi:hypothetical protein